MALFLHFASRPHTLLNCKQLVVRSWSCFLVTCSRRTVETDRIKCQNYNSLRCSSLLPSVGTQLPNDTITVEMSPACSEAGASPTEILSSLPPEEEKRLKVLKLEYDVFMSSGEQVPDTVTDANWLYLLRTCTSLRGRMRYYRYLYVTEKRKEAKRRKTALNIAKQEEKRRCVNEKRKTDTYKFMNTFNLFIRPHTMNRTYFNNLCYALMNGPHVVFDFSFEDIMKDFELNYLFTQIQLCHGFNKVQREPFHLHLCNVVPNSTTSRKLHIALPNLEEIPYTVTSQHYLECYDKSRIIYLSPDAPDVMQTYNYDDVYVIGSIVDKSGIEPNTFARAKKEGLRCVRFPLDEHIRWVKGTKSLTLDQVLNILLEMKKSNNWDKALTKYVPERKFQLY